MSQLDREALARLDAPRLSPPTVILTGLGLTVLGWLACLLHSRLDPVIGIVLVVVGLLAVGVGLALHYSTPRSAIENRFSTPLWWLLGAVAAFVGSVALEESADSISALLNLFALLAVFAAILSAVPMGYRLVGVSLLIAWHFFAVFTATQNLAPPSPWIATQVWTRVTRPYLQITHLNNAYHFYAPEPGPTALLWVRVRFADGTFVWDRLPNHEKCLDHIERRRLGGIASTLSQGTPETPTEDQIRQRDEAADRYDPKIPARSTGGPIDRQFRDPGPLGRLILESLARYFARTTRHPDGAAVPVVAVKIYRGEYMYPFVEHFQAGRDPLDPTLFSAWYLGEFDPEGTLVESSRRDMLYWLIPILRFRDNALPPADPDGKGRSRAEQQSWEEGGTIVNFLRIHAGDGNQEDLP